jgi:hypothetical protein
MNLTVKGGKVCVFSLSGGRHITNTKQSSEFLHVLKERVLE